MSAAALAEYLIMKPDQQETVLHNSQFASPPVVTPHSDAMRAIRSYNADPRRPQSALDTVKEALRVRSADLSITPKAREESLRCIETIELFERGENAFGLRSMPLAEAPKFPPLKVEGVLLSVQPDILVKPPAKAGQQRVGGIIFRPQKAPDPEACRLEETKRQRGEHRREMARYMLAMLEMMMKAHSKIAGGTFDRALSLVADIRMGERIDFSTKDDAARVRAIKAACKQVSQLWSGIEPRSSVLRKD